MHGLCTRYTALPVRSVLLGTAGLLLLRARALECTCMPDCALCTCAVRHAQAGRPCSRSAELRSLRSHARPTGGSRPPPKPAGTGESTHLRVPVCGEQAHTSRSTDAQYAQYCSCPGAGPRRTVTPHHRSWRQAQPSWRHPIPGHAWPAPRAQATNQQERLRDALALRQGHVDKLLNGYSNTITDVKQVCDLAGPARFAVRTQARRQSTCSLSWMRV